MTEFPDGADRQPQLSYSKIQDKMHDGEGRRRKARKVISVLHHYLGSKDLSGLSSLDIGCSAGFIANELAIDGALSTGIDIDVPGIALAREQFGDRATFICAAGDEIPFPDGSLDIVVFNHIYEHVVDADAVVSDIYRVLKPTGVAYLGLGNKYQLLEPHYGLPFLSWLPQGVADWYIRRAGKAGSYYEKHLSRSGLKTLLRGFHVFDYTVPVIRSPQTFGSGDQVGAVVSRLPVPLLQSLTPIVPTYIWIAAKHYGRPNADPAPEGLRYYDLASGGRSGGGSG